jgi:lipopolysaccharide export LptBFGC system permease protein LptF
LLIQLYVLRQLLVSIAFSVAGLSVIVLPTVAIQAVNKLGAISVGTVGRYLPLVVAELVPSLLPIAFILAVVATYGRLAAERELIAIKMAGIHPGKLAWPAFAVALPMVLGTNYLLGEVSPNLKYAQRNVIREADVSRFEASLEGRNVVTFGKNVLKSESTVGNLRRNVEFDLELEGEKRVKILAAEARLEIEGEYLVARMKDMRLLTEDMSSFNEAPVRTWKLSELFKTQPKDRSKPKYQTTSELLDALERGDLPPERRGEARFEVHRRRALSVTYFLFLLLGVPTGIALRSSTQLAAFTVAIAYAFLYYVIAKLLASPGSAVPVLSAWATDVLFAVVGMGLFVRTLWR